MAGFIRMCSAICLMLLAGTPLPMSNADAAEIASGTSSSIAVQWDGDQLAVRFADQDPVAVAMAIGNATGFRIDGIDGLRGQAPISWHFDALPVASALTLLAEASGRLIRREGPEVYVIGPAGEFEQVQALAQNLLDAQMAEDASRIETAERALLDFVRPLPEGPVLLTTEPWLDAAERAERRDDLKSAEVLLREASSHVQRRDGATGAEYGRSLARLGRIRALQGHDDEVRTLTEQGLALAQAELGQVDPKLAGMQSMLASVYVRAGRLDEAADLYRRAIQGYGEPEADSIEALSLAVSLDGLAGLYQQQDRWADAIPVLERSFSQYRAARDDGRAGFTAWQLGSALFELDRLPEAVPMLQFALDHGAPDRERTSMLLRSIQWLGPFATADATEADLAALLANPFPDDAFTAMFSISMLLEARASRLRRASPDTTQWRTTCAAYAIVTTADANRRDLKHVDFMRQRETERCEQQVREQK